MPAPDRNKSPSDESSTKRTPDQRHSPRDSDSGSGEDRALSIAETMIGVAMIFTGFLSIFLSISGGFEINVIPFLLYFAGTAVWAHAAIENPTVRYTVVTVSIALGLAIFHFGEVLFWHKQVVFWTTIAVVTFFMFKSSKK